MKRPILLLILFAISLLQAMGQGISSTDTFTVHRITGTYYADRFVGRKTANGEVFRQDLYTAAHKSLKFGTLVLVTNPDNGKQVIVRINDRCPKAGILDLTRRGARQIGISSRKVDIQILPQRYYTFWERQEEYLDLLEAGTFLSQTALTSLAIPAPAAAPRPAEPPQPRAVARTSPDKPAETPAPPAPKPRPQASKPAATEPKPKPKPEPAPAKPAPQLFDLELCTIAPNSEPRVVIEKLPIHYRNRVEVTEHDEALHIILKLSMTAQEIVEVQRDLYSLFPRSRSVAVTMRK